MELDTHICIKSSNLLPCDFCLFHSDLFLTNQNKTQLRLSSINVAIEVTRFLNICLARPHSSSLTKGQEFAVKFLLTLRLLHLKSIHSYLKCQSKSFVCNAASVSLTEQFLLFCLNRIDILKTSPPSVQNWLPTFLKSSIQHTINGNLRCRV